MAQELLSSSFPLMDNEMLSYLTGLLEDFSGDQEDLYEDMGPLISGLDPSLDDSEVEDICNSFYTSLNFSGKSSSNQDMDGRKLDAPVQLGAAAKTSELVEDSIWLVKRDTSFKGVDVKKLEKAEAKIKEKQERREKQGVQVSKPLDLGDATASQQLNRASTKADAAGAIPTDIRLENFDVSFGSLKLIIGASIIMSFGRRYGFVGRNGRGKSTLLRMISSGALKIPSHFHILHVEQEVAGDDTIALDSVLECDTKRTGLLAEEKSLNATLNGGESNSAANSRLAEVYHLLEQMEADRAPSRASVILSGLGFTADMQTWKTRQFSGGWRMRLALARALFAKPDLLLLDEPTNMLDMKAVIWLENYMQTWPTTLLVVSHDRSFLNNVSTDIFYLNNMQSIDSYKGDYDAFEKTYDEVTKNKIKEYEAQVQFKEHAQKFIDKFRFNAKRASLVQSKLKMLEKLPVLTPMVRESEVVLKFPESDPLQGSVLQLDEVSFKYTPEGEEIFSRVDISASSKSRICIVGENGAGKTTLLKILRGDLNPTKGFRVCHRNLRIGYFTQHHVDQMDMNRSAVELLAQKVPGKNSENYRNMLGQFGCTGDLAVRPLATLSGGQKSRVAFAAMCSNTPNFLILDEPTNHLDIETVEGLGVALNLFKGGVVLVSHDERLIRLVCTELWVAANHTVKSMEGGIDEYRKLIVKELEL